MSLQKIRRRCCDKKRVAARRPHFAINTGYVHTHRTPVDAGVCRVRPQRSQGGGLHAGTAFDGRHLFQISEDRIHKIDPKTGKVLATIPAPGNGGDSGMAWAEGTLWVGQHRGRKIHQIDPETGKVLRTIESNRVVTGVTWVDGELWHGTWEGDESDLRRIDPRTGEVLQTLEMPAGTGVSGLESDGGGCFFCGGGNSGKVRAVRRPR